MPVGLSQDWRRNIRIELGGEDGVWWEMHLIDVKLWMENGQTRAR